MENAPDHGRRTCLRTGFLADGFPCAHRAAVPYERRLNACAENETRFVRRRELPPGLATLVFNLGQELCVEHHAGIRAAYPAGTPIPIAVGTAAAAANRGWRGCCGSPGVTMQ